MWGSCIIFAMGGPTVAPPGSFDQGYAHLIDHTRPVWKRRRILILNAWIGLLLITSSTNGFDGSMMNGLQSLTQWQEAFNHPSGSKLGLLNAIQTIGSLGAIPFAPYMADGVGRRLTVSFGAVVMVGATVLQTASQSVSMFIGARFLIGWGLGFATSAAPMLITEIAFPSHRAQATAMYNALWALGSIIAAWTTFGTFHIPSSWSWRIPSAMQGLPSVIQVMFIWFVPESPRWLVGKGKEAQARKILAYYHADGNEQDPLIEYEFEEIKAAIEFDRHVAANVGWLSLIKTKGNRKRMRIIIALAFFSQWSGNGILSYYLHTILDNVGITSSTTQLLINGVNNIWSFLVAITAGYMVDYFGSRRLFLVSTIGMIGSWTTQTVCYSLYAQHGTVAAAHGVIAMLFVHSFFYCMAYTPLIVAYTVEILPFTLRAKGFTAFNFAISLSLIFNQYINPIALNAIGWKYYLIYVFWITFEAVYVYFFVVETKGRTLEETAALFDGDEAFSQLVEKAATQAGITQMERDEKQSIIVMEKS